MKAGIPIAIRPLAEADRAAWQALWADYLAFYGAGVADAVKAVTFARLIDPAEPRMRALIAEADGQAAGLVHYIFHPHCWRLEDVCYLQDLCVAPGLRGRGAGRALIEAVYAAADANGTPAVYWLTQDFNAEARRLYDRIGTLTPFVKYARPSADAQLALYPGHAPCRLHRDTRAEGACPMTIHIGAEPGDIAETVLMPGDPLRARWAAQTFLDAPRCVNEVRGMLGYTGTWKGNPVTIHGSGMGMPSLSIYANELIRDYGAKTLIRIGSAGAMQPHVRLRDVVVAMTASTLSTPSRGFFRELNFAPCADWTLLSAAASAAGARGIGTHVGGIYSADVFYDERVDLMEQLTRHGVLAVEMEAAELYTVAARHGARALAVLTVSDHLQTHEALPSAEREQGFADMVEIALAAAFP